jgi:hypothetical protein
MKLSAFGLIVALFLMVLPAVLLLLAWPFMFLWNYAVVSAITIAKPIGYWVSFWLMIFISVFIVGSKSGYSKS